MYPRIYMEMESNSNLIRLLIICDKVKEPPHIGVCPRSRIEAKLHPRTGNCLRRLRHEDPHCKALNIELKMNSQLVARPENPIRNSSHQSMSQ
jgi:hypothetical protein